MCGLCCDGSLFDRFRLDPDELPWAERKRLPLVQEDGHAYARQRCGCYDGSCTAYGERPRTCRAFRCKLLARVESGDWSVKEAMAVVGATRTQLAALRRKMEAARNCVPSNRLALLSRAQTDGTTLDLLLDIGVVRATCERHFVKVSEGDR